MARRVVRASDLVIYPNQPPPVTISVGTVLASAPGGEAAVENVGTDERLVLNFTIPRGIQGPRGILTRSITLEQPRHDENLLIMEAPENLLLSRVIAVVRGTGSVTFSLWQGAAPDSGTAIATGLVASAATPLWHTFSPKEAVAVGNFIWFTTSAQTPAADQLFINLDFEDD